MWPNRLLAVVFFVIVGLFVLLALAPLGAVVFCQYVDCGNR